MAVIENQRLLERRLRVLEGRGQRGTTPASARGALPDWAADALVQAGMTRGEIEAFNAETPTAQQDDEPEEADDGQTGCPLLADELLPGGIDSFAALKAVAAIALCRLRQETSTDPGDLGFAAREVVTLRLFEQVVGALETAAVAPLRQTG